RGRGCCAEVRQMQSTVAVGLEEIFQSPHDSRVPPVSTANLDPLALAQALDHYPGQRLLWRPCYLCTGEDFGSCLGDLAVRLLQLQQVREKRRRRFDKMRKRRRDQLASDQRLSRSRNILMRQLDGAPSSS